MVPLTYTSNYLEGHSYHSEDLLREIVVNEGCFQGEVPRGVDAVPLILRRLCGRLTHREQVKFWVISLVEEQFVSNTLYDYVPGVNRPSGTHQCGQNGISGKHITTGLSKLKVKTDKNEHHNENKIHVRATTVSHAVWNSYFLNLSDDSDFQNTNICHSHWIGSQY